MAGIFDNGIFDTGIYDTSIWFRPPQPGPEAWQPPPAPSGTVWSDVDDTQDPRWE